MVSFHKYDQDVNTGRVLLAIAIALAVLLGVGSFWRKAKKEAAIRNPAPIIVASHGRNAITAIAFAPDGKSLIAGRRNGELLNVSIDSGDTTQVCQLGTEVTAIAADSASERFVVGCANGQLFLLNRNFDLAEGDLSLLNETNRDVAPISPLQYYAEVLSEKRLPPFSAPSQLQQNSVNLDDAGDGLAVPLLTPQRSRRIESLTFSQRDFIIAATTDGLFHLVHIPSELAVPAFGSPSVPDMGASRRRIFRHDRSFFVCNEPIAVETKTGDDSWIALRWDMASRQMEVINEMSTGRLRRKPTVVAVSLDGKTMVFNDDRSLSRVSPLKAAPELLVEIPDRDSTVSKLTLSNDGRYVVIAAVTNEDVENPDSALFIWDAQDREFVFQVDRMPISIAAVTLAPDNSKVTVISADGSLRIWDTNIPSLPVTTPVFSGIEFAKSDFSRGEILAVEITPTQQAAPHESLQYSVGDNGPWTPISMSEKLEIADLPVGNIKLRFRLLNANWQPSNVVTTVITVRDDGILLWRQNEETRLGPLAAVFDLQTGNLKTLDTRKTFVERDARSAEIIQNSTLDHEALFHTAFNPTGTHLSLTARSFSAFKLFRLSQSPELVREKVQADPFHFVTIDEAGLMMAARTIYSDREIQVWNCRPDGTQLRMTLLSGLPQCFSTRSDYLASLGSNRVTIHSLGDGSISSTREMVGIQQIAKPAGADRLYFVFADRIEICTFSSLESLQTIPLPGAPLKVTHAVVAANEQRVAVADESATIHLLSIAGDSEAAPHSIHAHTDAVTVLALNATGELLFSVSKDGTSKMWDVDRLLPAGQ